jgi:NAD(P)-dependent dehydrogenase (short-subunit alcohol dehydrogenase family)
MRLAFYLKKRRKPMNDNDVNQQIDLTGQVAIVTGGGRGIGRAIALALAKAGAKVAVAARSADQLTETVVLIEQAGGCGMAVPTDVTDLQAVERMVIEVERHLGPVDLLVNNAGHPGQIGPFWEADPEAWWQCMDVNLRGPYLCSRVVVQSMMTRHHGRIVNTASHTGTLKWPHSSAYAVSKCAVIRFSENIAAETKEHGISVFAIHPGGVQTAMTETQFLSEAARKWFPKIYDYCSKGGAGQPPERAANLVVFLASGRADALSGCYIGINYDLEDLVRRAEEIQRDELYTLHLRT